MRKVFSQLLLILTVSLLPIFGHAGTDPSQHTHDFFQDNDGLLGVRMGSEFGSNHFRSYEAFLSIETKWSKTIRQDWLLRLDVEGALGALQRRGHYAAMANLGPVLAFEPVDGQWGMRVGFAPTVISRDEFGNVDLGGNLQFSSSISAFYKINKNYCILYRYQHTSNGGLRPSNPGVDLHSLGVAYRF